MSCNLALLECIHLEDDSPRDCCQISYTIDTDTSGATVSEVVKIRNWSMIAKPKKSDLNGACKVTIHIYRTTSQILINGKDAWAIVEMYVPILESSIAENANILKKLNTQLSE